MLSRSLSAVSKRAASAAAVRVATESVTKLPNGVTVASVEQHGAASQLVVAFRAGSRYENIDNQGAVHVLRNTIGSDSADYHGLSLIWNTAVQGGTITATSNRDVFAVRVAVPRDNATIAASLLGELANPVCKPWEIEEVAATVSGDSALRCRWASTIDALHQAAYRNGNLGNSNYVAEKTPGWKQIEAFKNKYFRSGNAVIIGVNVDHDSLVQGASGFRFTEGKPAEAVSSKYHGGESRNSAGGESTIVSIAGEGAALINVADVAAQAVASEILCGLVAKAGAVASGPVNLSYADSGLIGVVFEAKNDKIGQLTKSVASVIKGAKAEESAVKLAKAKAALKVLTASENGADVALDSAIQLLSTGRTLTPAEFADAVGNVSAGDVNKVFSKLSAKLSLSSRGNIREVPYLDEL